MATYIVVIVTTLILMSIYIIGVLDENLYENEQIKLFTKANMISDTVSEYIPVENTVAIEDSINQLLMGTGIRGIVVNPSYKVISDSNNELAGKVLMRDIIKSASEGEQAHTVLKDDNLGINMMTVAVPVKQKGGSNITAVIYLVGSLSDIDKTVGNVKMNLFLFSGLISVLIAFLSYGMSYIVTSPVDEFIEAAREISKGNFDKRVKVKGHDEFAQLAMTMNYMTSELGNLEDNRKKFISDASHELKTPLATIKLICDSIVTTKDPDPEMLKDFLGMLVNTVVKKLTPNANAKEIVLYTDYKIENPPALMLDYDRIWEAVYNICDNAIKYTGEGGFVKLGLSKEGKNIVIQIEDNGPGIPIEEQEHVFDRFYRLDDSRARETGGTGLGLAIAKEAVLLHGGTIKLSSEPGMGCVFSVYLPMNIENESPN